MDFISSKNIFLLTRDTLKLIDKRLMKHGSRTGYILYKILQLRGGYEKYEMAELVMLATLHDIGAYKTENMNDMLRFESKDYMQHSIYGFLFMKCLSPMEEKSKIILYHHIDYSQVRNLPYLYREEASFLGLAEKIDIYHHALGDKFQYEMLRKYADTKYSAEALDLFAKAEEEFHVFEQIRTEAFEKELDELMDYIMFTNEEKKRYMEMLMYCLGFRSQYKVVDSVTSICICEELAIRLNLSEEETEKLYYGALIHDIGMLAIPRDIVEAERALTKEEMEKMRTHVELLSKILSERMDQDVIDIAAAHHERLDGSGYPRGLKEVQMNLSQKILQVADTMTGLVNKRAYREPATRDQVIAVLREESDRHHLDEQVVETLVLYYDEILEQVQLESEQILFLQKKLQQQYEQVHNNFKK